MKSKVVIIAEAGVNHNGKLDLAYKLIDVAKDAGADYVKFQTAVPELVYSPSTPKAEYQIRNTGSDESQIIMAKKIHLPLEAYKELSNYCKEIGIKFLSTPFDHVSIDVLKDLGMDYYKIPSGEITNLPYLQKIAKLRIPIIMSTGMARLGEIEDALNVLYECGVTYEDISLLHCNTEYPTPMGDVNLSAMNTLSKAFGIQVGYSDHTQGIEIPIAAVALGATIIEKHFTLDKTMEGPDHLASLEPSELKAMISAIRNIEIAMGSGIKVPSASERKNIAIARKSIHAQSHLKLGHVVTEEDLIMKRPGDGLSPMLMQQLVGRTLTRSVDKDHKFDWQDIQ